MKLTNLIRQLESQLKNAEKLARTYETQVGALKGKLAGVASIVGHRIAKFVASGGLPRQRKGKMSAAGKAKIRAAQKERWAAYHAKHGFKKVTSKRKGSKLSRAHRAKIAASQKVRWAQRRRKSK